MPVLEWFVLGSHVEEDLRPLMDAAAMDQSDAFAQATLAFDGCQVFRGCFWFRNPPVFKVFFFRHQPNGATSPMVVSSFGRVVRLVSIAYVVFEIIGGQYWKGMWHKFVSGVVSSRVCLFSANNFSQHLHHRLNGHRPKRSQAPPPQGLS